MQKALVILQLVCVYAVHTSICGHVHPCAGVRACGGYAHASTGE